MCLVLWLYKVCAYITHVCIAFRGQRGCQNSLKLQLLQIVYGYVDAGNKAQVFWNSSQCFYFLSSWVIIAHRYASNESEWRWPKKHSYFKKKLTFWSSWLWYICYTLWILWWHFHTCEFWLHLWLPSLISYAMSTLSFLSVSLLTLEEAKRQG